MADNSKQSNIDLSSSNIDLSSSKMNSSSLNEELSTFEKIKILCCKDLCLYLCCDIFIIIKSLVLVIMLLIKLICQFVEFYILILLTNIIIEYKIIIISSMIGIKPLIILSFIFNCIFDYISINVLTIYYFEFFKFSWLNYDLFSTNLVP